MATANNKIAPENISLSAAEAPVRSRPLPKEPITKAPRIAFQTDPRPPNKEVPPITAAPMACNNKGEPPANALNDTEPYREAPTIPPIAAMTPTMPKAATLIRLTFIPTRRALSALPPTAKIERPKGVDPQNHPRNAVKAISKTISTGTPL